MPVIEGPWMGQGTKARINVSYTRTYNAARTRATFAGRFEIEFNGRVNDNSNVYNIMGDCGNQSGSKNYSFGTAGGKKDLGDPWSFSRSTNGDVKANADNIADVGGVKIIGDFILPIGDLAPEIDPNNSFFAWGVTPTSFIGDISPGTVDPNGAITRTQLQYNTIPNESGAPVITTNWQSAITVPNLAVASTYYWRMRLENNVAGWSEWSVWKSVTTAGTVPSQPWLGVTSVRQLSADITAASAENGYAIDAYEIAVNTTPSLTGATQFWTGALTGLMPNTLYYFAARAHNSLGWGPWSTWGTFYTKPSVFVNVNGVWRNAVPYVNVNGVWKRAERIINSQGIWKV